jgi:hypothetical protein
MLKKLIPCLVVALAVLGCGQKSPKNSGAATVEDLNRALGLMTLSGAPLPRDIIELTNFPTLQGKTLPVPPAGKKYVVDRAAQRVVVVDN